MLHNKVFIGNLPPGSVSEDDLRSAFEKFGVVEQVVLKPGFAFVKMADDAASAQAIEELNGK